jgi:hypothetical protein
MTDETTPAAGAAQRRRRTRAIASAAAVGAVGVVAGGVLATTMSANAAGSDTATGTYGGYSNGAGNGNTDPSKPMRSDEKLLTGITKAKVLAVVKAKYPKATIQRVETDSDGVYEAHIVNSGTPTIVQVGKDFTITGTQAGGGHGGGGRDDHDGDGPGAAPAA